VIQDFEIQSFLKYFHTKHVVFSICSSRSFFEMTVQVETVILPEEMVFELVH